MLRREVAQLVAHHVRDVGVGRSNRLFSTRKHLSRCFLFTLLIVRARAYILYVRVRTHARNDQYILIQKMPILSISYLRRKCSFRAKKMPKYLVSPKKSSTFAPDLRLRLVNLKNGKNLIKKCNAENQPLTKKMTK